MNKNRIYPIIQAMLAAILFGISAPLSKVLLGNINPVPLVTFMYLGSGIGLLIFQAIIKIITKKNIEEASLSKKDVPWLVGAITFGGVIAPIVLMFSLQKTPASTASLLMNFELVATAVIALFVFKENIGKRVGLTICLITLSSIFLSWDFNNQWGISVGALGVIIACICWGIDNNFIRNISAKNPFTIIEIKGITAGLFSLILSFVLKSTFPNLKIILCAMFLGFISYGLSIVLYVFAMRNLGSTRASLFFGTAPFIGSILSLIIYRSMPSIMFIIALPTMLLGTVIMFKDSHEHRHLHDPVKHEHKHSHNDDHHNHIHEGVSFLSSNIHSHVHEHEFIEHIHQHMPDIHHRHSHKQIIISNNRKR